MIPKSKEGSVTRPKEAGQKMQIQLTLSLENRAYYTVRSSPLKQPGRVLFYRLLFKPSHVLD